MGAIGAAFEVGSRVRVRVRVRGYGQG